ncbi:MAG: YcgN family cysteine cluster protein [Sulfuricurvum sp.]|uniref:YcgN family cysteine cluster protein n=1 Tax=Sulfuricurvum sp. TaxID=2025608 RepID=UPI0026029ED2|nr:YcgN family cysteine cluster protein [Sulfuricurvum sp.]MDD2829161.1 YcgN family cysteine cluster protein [Sulfuricurvum sp.]MDD4950210.1 YcgN family cysteine cluster protein [Sulfuricurvum sp.]
MLNTTNNRFWETKSLKELSKEEWEMLCDGCGLCCLHRLQGEEEDAPILTTRVVCRCYDLQNGGCSNYPERFKLVEECTQLTIDRAAEFDWLPPTCAYRLRYHNQPLPSWHPLNSGIQSSVKPYSVFSLSPVLETENIDLEDFLIS